MFLLGRRQTARIGALGLAMFASGAIIHSKANMAKKEDEDLCVYLPPESRTLLSRHMDTKLGIKVPVVDQDGVDVHALGREVVLKPKLNESDAYIYRPLFGERAAFRLKGLITTSQGDVVGIGRVANLTGELFDEEYEASILLKTDAPASEKGRSHREFLRDLPTRVYQGVALSERGGDTTASTSAAGHVWKGTLPTADILGKAYPAISNITVRNLLKEQQIVLDGRVCGSLCADAVTGTCNFDRSEVSSDEAPATLAERRVDLSKHANAAHLEKRRNAQLNIEVKGGNTAVNLAEATPKFQGPDGEDMGTDTTPTEPVETCPVCRYMKGGPCKDEFIVWDACIQGLKDGEDVKACYEPTASMMGCMQSHEYYDPMTSNQQR